MTERTRFLRFNIVGVAGFAVQMLTLAALEKYFAVPAGVAVTLAVLAAVSHNFLWHERVTWPGQPHEGRWRRWLSFNVSTGVVSVLTNLIVTTIVAAATGAPLLIANMIAVVAASLVNFWVSDRAVFNRRPRAWAARSSAAAHALNRVAINAALTIERQGLHRSPLGD
jgi:putative flippase GtrA